MDKHVFISYQHNDGDFADVLIGKIQQVSFKAWVDSDKLRAGVDWRMEIDQAIKSAFALVVVKRVSICKNSLQEEHHGSAVF